MTNDSETDEKTAPKAPGSGAVKAPDAEDESLDRATIIKLGVVCLILWIIAGGILATNWRKARIDYYLGNMAETIGSSGELKDEDLNAIVSMGPSVIPKLVKELNASSETGRLGVSITVILGKIGGPEATAALREALKHPSSQVRNNALKQLFPFQGDKETAADLKALWELGNPQARLQMLSFTLLEAKKELALPYILSGVGDKEEVMRQMALAVLNNKFGDLNIPAKGYQVSQVKLKLYAQAVKVWIVAGAKKALAPKFPALDLKKKPAIKDKK
jgi:hypothetical protein